MSTQKPTHMITHKVIDDSENFIVEFTCGTTGLTAIQKFMVPLTTKEIEAMYDYIVFREEPLVCKDCSNAIIGPYIHKITSVQCFDCYSEEMEAYNRIED